MNNYALLGLPGLYQNWLLTALDPDSKYRLLKENNFKNTNSCIAWLRKFETNLETISNNYSIINTYVNADNFVWYLYNFLEKTDGVGIEVKCLTEQIFTKAPGTIAFDGMLKHFVDSYQCEPQQDQDHLRNCAIEYFYLLLINQSAEFKTKTQMTNQSWINIEYKDFGNLSVLQKKLQGLPSYESQHFANMYDMLRTRNCEYLDRHLNFVKKLQSNTCDFDILETAYLGYLLYKQDQTRLDWFNADFRNFVVGKRFEEICNRATDLLK